MKICICRYSFTKAFCIAFVMTFFSIFDVPVFWPILLCYWIVLFVLTMRRQISHMIKYKYLPFSFGKQVTYQVLLIHYTVVKSLLFLLLINLSCCGNIVLSFNILQKHGGKKPSASSVVTSDDWSVAYYLQQLVQVLNWGRNLETRMFTVAENFFH